ncbi:hypothetical protein KC19_11G123200 [Ceratodon purpureus]|uniref:Fungal lipase-like domain-containing protein n=1 Tax=Ceratodon purpureus TaxID=3225 RepID=A0A8T0GGS1_CERPU|nr:hypothetical protein KC19_11G123200 [Ceratodon purpureus]
MENARYCRCVCVAGHSLGAALALQATRVLALLEPNGVLLETHLFNPPNCSPDVVLKKGFTGVVNGVSDSMGPILGDRYTTAARDKGKKVADIIDQAVRDLINVLPFVKRHKEEMNDEAQKLKQVGYAPYIYVNEKDPICNEYIKYFKPGELSTPPSPPTTSTTAPLGELSPWTRLRSRSAHMVPRAHLFINHWAEGPSEAHRLHQWFLYPTVNLEEYVAKSDEGEVSGCGITQWFLC